MIKINSTVYRYVLLDTNALSSFLQKPGNWIKFIESEFLNQNPIICYSIFTLSELFFRQELFEKYLDVFSSYPSLILDGHESILHKEISNYENEDLINPVVLAPFSIGQNSSDKRKTLEKVISESEFISRTNYWKSGKKEILDGIISLKLNYPQKSNTYTKKEIEEFVLSASTEQVGMRQRAFAKRIVTEKLFFDIDKLASLKCMSYFVFYKFYPDNRTPIESDVFDLLISSILPYVDYFITEGNNSEIIRKIQTKHDFLNDLKSYSIKNINKQIGNYV